MVLFVRTLPTHAEMLLPPPDVTLRPFEIDGRYIVGAGSTFLLECTGYSTDPHLYVIWQRVDGMYGNSIEIQTF